jgi:predicted porin
MKKSLLALAILGSFAGSAFAQTNVSIYGIADVGISRTKVTGEDALWSMDSGIQSGSRLGFKGSEDLGGGMSAIFTLENGFLVDTGGIDQAGQLFGRQAWVGLNGGFGAVKLGRQYTPIFGAIDSVDPFETGLAFGAGALMIFNPAGLRMNNTINYSLPSNLGGLYGELAYGLGEVPGNNTARRQLGLSVGYANGPVRAVLAYHNAKDATGNESDRTTFIGGTYDFSVAKIHAAFADNKGLGASVGGIGEDVDAASLAGFDVKSRDYMLGVSAPVGGVGSVLASFMRKDFRDLPAGADIKADVWAIGYTHNLSKRTNLYTTLARAKVDVEVPGASDSAKATNFNVGIRHKF